MNLTLHVWRQLGQKQPGRMVTYQAKDVSPDMSFLEMLDIVNENLIVANDMPIAFEHDCREGICGSCSMTVNGIAHGPERGTTVCQLHMRHFKDGDSITIEPWRAKAFPVVRDLIVDRSAFDRITQAGGFVSVNTGGAPDANALPIFKGDADEAFDAAACIACGACVAGCKNGSAMLYVSAKISHFSKLPQGQPERGTRVLNLLQAMEDNGFGACSNQYECEAVCPKSISVRHIARANREFIRASLMD